LRIEKVDKQTTRRYDGSEIVVAEGVAGDSTGVIKFRVSGGNSIYL
jgi:replication factor A1